MSIVQSTRRIVDAGGRSMPIHHALGTVSGDPREVPAGRLASEHELERMIAAAPQILSNEWMLIERQEHTGFGGRLDLLALAPDGSLVLIELKRDRTPREVVAQALDYAGWVERLGTDDIAAIYHRFAPGHSLADDFRSRIARDRRLVLRGRAVEGPLHLLPRHENGLTFAFGFALSTVPRLVDQLLAQVGIRTSSSSDTLRIVLQDRSERDGITDVEIQEANGSVLALLEAKASGWPGLPQLSKYARRKGVVPRRTAVVALGVPPAPLALTQKAFLPRQGQHVRLCVLRWVDVLSMVHAL